jgi:hypothetical protein
MQISCTFQWYRVSNGKEEVIAGADKASYVVTKQDVGHLLKVVRKCFLQLVDSLCMVDPCAISALGDYPHLTLSRQARIGSGEHKFILTLHGLCCQVGLPTVKETNEHGQPVSAIISQPVNPKATSGNGSNEDDATLQPRLIDWKIEMNPRQEYVDPIRMHYTYAGGVEGNSIVQWFREVFSLRLKVCATRLCFVIESCEKMHLSNMRALIASIDRSILMRLAIAERTALRRLSSRIRLTISPTLTM